MKLFTVTNAFNIEGRGRVVIADSAEFPRPLEVGEAVELRDADEADA
jgi:hypothetical protein